MDAQNDIILKVQRSNYVENSVCTAKGWTELSKAEKESWETSKKNPSIMFYLHLTALVITTLVFDTKNFFIWHSYWILVLITCPPKSPNTTAAASITIYWYHWDSCESPPRVPTTEALDNVAMAILEPQTDKHDRNQGQLWWKPIGNQFHKFRRQAPQISPLHLCIAQL